MANKKKKAKAKKSKKNNAKKQKKSNAKSSALKCIRDGTTMDPFTENKFKGSKCSTCGYYEGKVDPKPKKKRGVAFIECPDCGKVKAMEIDDADRIGVLCTNCGYSAGRILERVSNEQLSKLDEEIATLQKQIDPKVLKSK